MFLQMSKSGLSFSVNNVRHVAYVSFVICGSVALVVVYELSRIVAFVITVVSGAMLIRTSFSISYSCYYSAIGYYFHDDACLYVIMK